MQRFFLPTLRTTVAGAIACSLVVAAPVAAAGERSSSLAQEPPAVTWERQRPTPSPPPNAYGELAYDQSDQRMIMFGGKDLNVWYDDTWAWDGTSWTELQPTSHPSWRTGHAMAYDPVREEIVLFGGIQDDLGLADTWVFRDGGWERRTPATSPPATYGATMGFDPHLQQLILFGGGLTVPPRRQPARVRHGAQGGSPVRRCGGGAGIAG